MWIHVAAVLGLVAVCALWVVLQRSAAAAGCSGSGECESCGANRRECGAPDGSVGR